MRGRKQRMEGGSLYWPIENRTLRSTIVLNVSFKKKIMSPKTNSKWSHINPNTRIRGIF